MACSLLWEDSKTSKKFPLIILSTFPNFWFSLCHINRLWKEHQGVIQDRGQHQEGTLPNALLLRVGHRMILGGSLNAKCESEKRWAPSFLKSEGIDFSRHSAGAVWLIEISQHHWESEVMTEDTCPLSPQETVTKGHLGVQGHSLLRTTGLHSKLLSPRKTQLLNWIPSNDRQEDTESE